MEPLEWILAGAVVYALFPGVRRAVGKTWNGLQSATNQAMEGVGQTAQKKMNTMDSPENR
ncbi:hypothetical protein [Effusibacillus dendaii]|uniref:Uncharacterized protein n=1 Tax=Effusibacillus dendaii TaxID=2743772 RepID=A0A7I8DHJ1_9BACL|nr:hypothetical protein [Effusibacillus dendaii]BCJ88376.1 hypothetical protein skT53_33610 [Effusibacillus dendaii]